VGSCAGSYESTTQKPVTGHMNMGNYAFADGHVKVMRWGNVRANDFYLFKRAKPSQTFTP
jgi:prepilin-type processing-associated H-X9-DG protein